MEYVLKTCRIWCVIQFFVTLDMKWTEKVNPRSNYIMVR